MAALTGSKAFRLFLLMLSMLFILFGAHVHARAEDRGTHVEGEDGLSKSSVGEHVMYGSMSFSEDHESFEHPTTCTCTCVPGAESSPKAPKPPTSQNSPTDLKRSPPPAPYYSPTPVDNSPSPPPGSTQSPVTFNSPPPPAPYSNVPTYGEPSPVVAAPETFPPPPPIY